MRVITLAKTKELLGISNTTYDDKITAQIPIVDAKVKQICHNNFNLQIDVGITDESATVGFTGTNNIDDATPELMQLTNDLPVGTLLEGTGIPVDTYILETYYTGLSYGDRTVPTFTMSEDATEDNAGVIYAGINIAYQPVIAKGIWWSIGQLDTNITDTTWTSRSVGAMSVSKGAGSERLEAISGMPYWFVKGLPRYHG